MDPQDRSLERPRRLLHVPSMTSVTWESIVTGLNETPIYNAVSYTWGRFTSNDAPLELDGVSWRVPGVHPSHFTAAEFHHILKSIAPESGYVWVDIACIDQEYLPMKMEEIGKQGDIFRGAKNAFVWLTTHKVKQLTEDCHILREFDERLMTIKIDESNFSYDKKAFQALFDSGVSAALEAAERLLADPWFTSLWALQEAYLRQDATLLSKDGDPVYIPERKKPLDLDTLSAIFQQLSISLRAKSFESREEAHALLELFEQSGLLGMDILDIPVQIYPAAHARKCRNEVDRVYAIMQVYGLRLGSSRDPHRVYTLDELEEELVESLNRVSPLAAQLFIHRKPPRPGKAWVITRDCIFPPTYYLAQSLDELCTLTPERGVRTTYKGRECRLDELVGCWAASTGQRNEQYLENQSDPKYRFHHYQANIDLDAGHIDQMPRMMFFHLMEEPLPNCSCGFCKERTPLPAHSGLQKLEKILPLPITQYKVLEVARAWLTTLVGDMGTYGVSCHLGVLGTTEQHGNTTVFRRVGLCSWEKAQGELIAMHEAIWTVSECHLA